jgi:CheY-like chemotaxis protein
MIRRLEMNGYQTCWAANGEAAIRMLETEDIDLVLLDLILGPGIDGWGVARHKLFSQKAAKIPFIVVSGLDPQDAFQKGERNPLSGALLFVGKPVDMDLLISAIEMLQTASK